ncbi:gluconate 2-dehydrogenase subunit 3 family protein [Pedococcus sp. 5OH_020]|uniref:gluconate 2-dehydrogenase subunit 3 family protein n=1 Tax=Pedococcus sp. 5OH_020 TaxID=2989814 RepID=UPI0022E9A92D|nr:gluconate 2-dehydrogenase subunit 3 family protein [Pedococcus sp. 5OH_020]
MSASSSGQPKLPLSVDHGGGRYPGLDTLGQSSHWDMATTGVVAPRVGIPVGLRFFTQREEAVACALTDQLLGQHEDPRVPVVRMIDSRLAEGQGDGWHHVDMPPDDLAWRNSLAALEEDACSRLGAPFADCSWPEQEASLRAIQRWRGAWHGMPAQSVWSLWTRYADTAFYAHPWAWDEIGFGGPAYPRGYKHLGLDAREPWEVKDIRPTLDPLRLRENP